MIKLTKSYLKQLIRECLNETPIAGYVPDSTVDRRLYNQGLKQGHTLYEPTFAEEQHERMRMESLLFHSPNPQQYYLRLTKITKPQKMYGAYLMLSNTYAREGHAQKKQLLWKAIQIAVKYLMKNGYGAYVKPNDRRIFG
jgi:hypothetical protein